MEVKVMVIDKPMPVEMRLWWPVALETELGDQPLALQLLGRSLVLWRDAQGEPVVMDDRCPHRGARLSLGQVEDGTLQCAYHGWRFDASGRCVSMPAQPAFVPPATNTACRHASRRAHGLVWACLGEPAGDPPALHDLAPRRLIYGPFDVATSAPRAVENFLDTAHFAYVHRGWLGEATHPEVPHYDVSRTADGRPVIEQYKAWQPRATASSAQGDWVNYRYEVLGPFSALLTKRPDGGGPQDSYVVWACPTDDEHCRLWFAQYTSDETSSDEELRDFQVTIFSQDQPILESQQPARLPISGGELMGSADRLSAAYRRYLQQLGITFGVC
jgi:phenylpropionate dioxygenase-like ring-hydroxylating dioxygenase large terminal subunit